MDWASLTVEQLRETLSRHNVDCSPALYRKKSDLIGACEVSLTAEHLVNALRQYNKLPAPKRRSSSASRRTPIRTAGRFSLASEDGLQASPRLKNTYYSGGRKFVPAGEAPSSPEDFETDSVREKIRTSPVRRTSRKSLKPDTPFLPVRDPDGNPVRWQIHNPYVIDLVSDDEKSANVSPKTKKPKKKRVKILWGRILFLVILVLSIICVPHHYIKRSFVVGVSTLASMVLPKTRIYCDTNTVAPDCLPCPDHAICEGGKVTCESPRYVLVRSFGTMRCVADQAADKAANRLRSELVRHLRNRNGQFQCTGSVDSVESVYDNKYVALTIPSIENFINKLQIQSPRLFGGDGAKSIFLADLQQEAEVSIDTGLKTTPEGSFYITGVDLPFKCKAKQLAWKQGPYFIAILVVYLWLRSKYRNWRFNKALKVAVTQVIRDNTRVQRLNDQETRQGYAIGPRPDDIYEILKDSTKKWNVLLGSRLKKKNVADMCERLVAQGSVCRSLLAADMTPFYFDRTIIERGKLN